MSIGPMGGVFASVAGTSLAQANGSDVDRARQDATSQQRQIQSVEKGESAAGIGKTDGEEHEANDRDADGRRLWEIEAQQKRASGEPQPPALPRLSKDATGTSGNELDLSG